jgi:hypothetical protein
MFRAEFLEWRHTDAASLYLHANDAAEIPFLPTFSRVAGAVPLALGLTVATQTGFFIKEWKQDASGALTILKGLTHDRFSGASKGWITHLSHLGDLKRIRLVVRIAKEMFWRPKWSPGSTWPKGPSLFSP